MACIKDAEILAVQRACAGMTEGDTMDFAERYFDGRADVAEVEAVRREFAKIATPTPEPDYPLVITGQGSYRKWICGSDV